MRGGLLGSGVARNSATKSQGRRSTHGTRGIRGIRGMDARRRRMCSQAKKKRINVCFLGGVCARIVSSVPAHVEVH